MNTDHIRTFLAVYRAGNFIAVAKDRNVSPSSITQSIAALEGALKTRLFQRSTRTVSPTEAGDDYYRRMSPIMEAFDEAHDQLLHGGSGPRGRLRVTASTSYGQIVLAPLIKSFRDRYPDIQLELILSDRRIDLISEQIDVAIRHGQLPNSTMVARKLANVSYQLVASPGYLCRKSAISTPADLAEHDLITFTYDDFRHDWHFNNGREEKTQSINPVLTLSNAAAIRQCVRDGVGIALLADWTVQKDLEAGTLITLLPKWEVHGASEGSNLWLVYPSGRFIPAKTRVFAEFMRSHYG